MQLYQVPYSHFSAKVRIVALEKGLEVELPPIPGGALKSPEFLAINPLGKIPVLVDGEICISESEVIVEYLNDRYPEPAMLPQEPSRKAYARWLSRFHDLYLAPQLSVLYSGVTSQRVKEPEMAIEVEKLHSLLHTLESQINPAPYFLGEQFSLADATYSLSWWYTRQLARTYGQPINAAQFPKLTQWFAAASQRNSVSQVIADAKQALAKS